MAGSVSPSYPLLLEGIYDWRLTVESVLEGIG